MTKRISILLVDDHRIVRECFHQLLEQESDLEVVGEAENGRQAVALAKKLVPDVLLMDIAMPLINGLDSTRQVLKALPKTKVLILSAHHDDAYIQSAVDAGAVGFLLKQTSSHEVYQAIREVHRGKTFFGSPISKRLHRLQQPSPHRLLGRSKQASLLSEREIEVLQWVTEGGANQEIAAKLKVSVKTIEKHREHIMEKLDLHDVAGLTRYAVSAGLIANPVQLAII